MVSVMAGPMFETQAWRQVHQGGPMMRRILFVAEGSGGHLIPALEVSQALAAEGASVMLLYARRPQIASLMQELIHDVDADHVHVRPFSLSPCPIPAIRGLWRLRQAGAVWREAREHLSAFQPHVVVGFGGWLSVPVILAAQREEIPVLIHEQNVRLGRANRFLLNWADQIALSFEETRAEMDDAPTVVSGLPIRRTIGTASREAAARQFGLEASAPTVLVLGGSQGSGVLNQLMCGMLPRLSSKDREAWQFLHLTGIQDEEKVAQAYAGLQLRARVAAHLAEMASAYALADVVIARAGASTIAELAQCGTPAIVIPYPHASGHQRANARLLESAGAGVVVDERTATSERLLGVLQQLLQDERLRRMMSAQMHTLAQPDATQRLARAILTLAATRDWN